MQTTHALNSSTTVLDFVVCCRHEVEPHEVEPHEPDLER